MFRTVQRNPASSAHHIPTYFNALDFLRFLAAVVVLLDHYPMLFRKPDDAGGWLESPYSFPGINLELAVQLFWMLSGFVFLFQYYGRTINVTAFAWARFARLYPLHLATLLSVVVLQFFALRTYGEPLLVGNFDLYHFILQLGLISAWGFESGPSFNGPIWSVSVEILIYILFVLVLPLLRRGALVSLGMSVLCFGSYVMLFPHMALLCGTYFFAGAFAFEVVRRLSPVQVLAVAVALLMGVGSVHLLKADVPETMQIMVMFFSCICAVAVVDCRHPNWFPGPQSAWNLGNYSYAIYLIHLPMMLLFSLVLFPFVGTDTAIYGSLIMPKIYFVVTIAVSVVVYHRFERPAKKWLLKNGPQQQRPLPMCQEPSRSR